MRLPIIEALDLRPWYVTMNADQLLPDTEMWMAKIVPMFPGLPLLRYVEDDEVVWDWPEFPRNVACLIEHGFWPRIRVRFTVNTAQFDSAVERVIEDMKRLDLPLIVWDRINDYSWSWQRPSRWMRVLQWFGLAGSVKAW